MYWNKEDAIPSDWWRNIDYINLSKQRPVAVTWLPRKVHLFSHWASSAGNQHTKFISVSIHFTKRIHCKSCNSSLSSLVHCIPYHVQHITKHNITTRTIFGLTGGPNRNAAQERTIFDLTDGPSRNTAQERTIYSDSTSVRSASTRRTSLWIGLSNKPRCVRIRQLRTTLFSSLNTSMILASCQSFRKLESFSRTTSPTAKFRVLCCHFDRRCNVCRYSFFHLLQNSLAMCWTRRQRLLMRRSQAPPIWLDAGGFLFHPIHSPPCCWRKISIVSSSILLIARFISLSQPTKLVPLSERSSRTWPLRPMKRRNIMMKWSVSMWPELSRWTARVFKQVKRATNFFKVDLRSLTWNGPNMSILT